MLFWLLKNNAEWKVACTKIRVTMIAFFLSRSISFSRHLPYMIFVCSNFLHVYHVVVTLAIN